MKNKPSKKKSKNNKKKTSELGQTKNSAKFVLFIFGIGPIIGIIIFLFSKGFFNSPNIQFKVKKKKFHIIFGVNIIKTANQIS